MKPKRYVMGDGYAERENPIRAGIRARFARSRGQQLAQEAADKDSGQVRRRTCGLPGARAGAVQALRDAHGRAGAPCGMPAPGAANV